VRNSTLTNVETIRHFLQERGGDVVIVDGHSLRLEVDGAEFYIHKLGRSERDDPWTSLPGDSGPAGRATESSNQLRLDLGPVAEGQPRIWVIGHYGTLEDGVRAIRLQASGAADAGRIRSWLRVVDLWVASDGGTDAATPPAQAGPPPVDVADALLTPKRARGVHRHQGER